MQIKELLLEDRYIVTLPGYYIIILLQYDIYFHMILNILLQLKTLFCLSRIIGTFSVAGFELTLHRKITPYILSYYLPSGMFVIVSWISFLVPAHNIPGRMGTLVTLLLVLINIFNSIITHMPKADGKLLWRIF